MAGLLPLGQIAGNTGLIIDGDWVESKDQDPDGEVRLVQLADIGVGSFLDKSNRFMTAEKAVKLKCTYLEEGDILVARMPDPLGRACQFPGDQRKCVTVVDVCILRPDAAVADAAYITHVLNSDGVRRQLDKFIKGTTRQRISRTNLEQIRIPLPPLPEQRRIAAILDQADALRAKRREALAQLDSLTQSIFMEMFGDPAANPQGFPVKQLSELIATGDSINYGVVQPGDDVDDGIPLVRVGDLIGGRVQHEAIKRIEPSIECAYKRSRLVGDEILVSCVGSIGVVALATEAEKGFNIARAVARIRMSPATSRVFMAAQLGSATIQRYFTQELRTVSQPTLNIKQLAETRVIVPPIDLQNEFEKRVEALGELVTTTRSSAQHLDSLFSSLQHRAFRGEL